jgi:pimeloyl-ACP methyl ester carboxylesterase
MHGFGSSQLGEKAEFFRQRCLGEGFVFVSFDFQGHGESGGSIRDLTVSRCLRDVERVRKHVDAFSLRPMVLMGSSMGGLVGLWIATSQPAAAGAFVAPALGLDESFPSLIGDEGMRRWEESGILPITNEMGTFELGWGFVEDLRARRPEHLTELHRLPTIIFQGQLDDRVSWENVEQFADRTPDLTRLVLFADGDHRLLDEKEIIWSETRSFLGEIGLIG